MSSGSSSIVNSSNTWAAGADLLDSMLAETGYAIPQSQLPELADRIQYLESLVSGTQICDFVSDSGLFTNPSDISTWINSLIKSGTTNSNPATQPGELLDDHLPPQPQPQPQPQPELQQQQQLDSDLEFIHDICSSKPGAGNSNINNNSGNNSVQSSNNSNGGVPVTIHHLVGEDEEQEAEASGVKLIHLLLACASCIDDLDQLHNTEAMMNEIRLLLLAMGGRAGAMGRIALYFAQGLEQRLMQVKNHSPASGGEDHHMLEDPGFLEMLHLQFYHTCPYLKFGHFTSNQAMLEEMEGEKAVHIIDLDLGLGLQWPPLIHMLAIGGTPFIRFTAVVSDDRPQLQLQLQETGTKLGQLAKSVGVELRFHMANDIKSVQLHAGEAVAVNSMLYLHRLLQDPGLVAGTLATIHGFNPRIFTVVEQEADHNNESFQNRFFDALHFYSSLFDAIDAAGSKHQPSQHREEDDAVMASEAFLGREIRNIVASEGKARVERHERLEQWRHRLFSLGFRPRHLGSNAYNQAATLLTIFPGGHLLYESAGCLTLAWHTRPLFTASAWRCR